MQLDRSNPLPLRVQLESIVRKKIESGEWPVNSIIPSENELSRIYGVGRMTARGVLSRIVNAGMLFRVPGKGTFVAARTAGKDCSPGGRVREQLERRGCLRAR